MELCWSLFAARAKCDAFFSVHLRKNVTIDFFFRMSNKSEQNNSSVLRDSNIRLIKSLNVQCHLSNRKGVSITSCCIWLQFFCEWYEILSNALGYLCQVYCEKRYISQSRSSKEQKQLVWLVGLRWVSDKGHVRHGWEMVVRKIDSTKHKLRNATQEKNC